MQSHDHPDAVASSKTAFLTSPAGLVLMAVLAIAGAYFWIAHRAHLLGTLVWLPIGVCLLMHIFMHHGHGGYGKQSAETRSPSDGAAS